MNVLKKTVNISLIQLAGSTPDKFANLARAESLIAKTMEQYPKTEVIVLPECFNSPYSVKLFRKYAEPIVLNDAKKAPSVFKLSQLALKHKILLIGGSIPEIEETTGKVYNTSLVFNSAGELVGQHRKLHLFDIDIPNGITFKESVTLSPGNKITTIDNSEQSGLKFGLGICYDMRFPEPAMYSSRVEHANCLIYPSAFNTVTGPLHWHLLAKVRSMDNQVYTILCSPSRAAEGLTDEFGDPVYRAYGHSLVVNPKGEILVEAGEEEEILNCELDGSVIDSIRQAIPIGFQRRFDVYEQVKLADE
ncbi:hypothetical protein QEN19_003820 [Hanseniaspora menglaensis]